MRTRTKYECGAGAENQTVKKAFRTIAHRAYTEICTLNIQFTPTRVRIRMEGNRDLIEKIIVRLKELTDAEIEVLHPFQVVLSYEKKLEEETELRIIKKEVEKLRKSIECKRMVMIV
jgi:stage V sporulation protein SpoVS